MAQLTPFIGLVAALLIGTLSYCSAENVYCVTSTATSCSSCPHNSAHCTTLSEYAQEAKLYFTSNTIIVFLPGDHILDKNITVADKTSLIMRGGSFSGNIATIVCNGPVGLNFSNMVNFKIQSLGFTSCSRTFPISRETEWNLITAFLRPQNKAYGLPLQFRYVLFVQLTQSTELVNCSFHDNIGTALAVLSSSITLTGNNNFTHNHCGPNSCILGGGIAAFNGKLTFIGNTTFLENNGHVAGAGIFMIYTSLNSTGSIHFINNLNSGHVTGFDSKDSAVSARGTIWTYASHLHFTGTNNFINNSVQPASGSGGAIYALGKSDFTFTGVSNFKQNFAGYGGAINAYSTSSFTFTGVTNFKQNSATVYGGAINAFSTISISFTGVSNFKQNSATKYGGAIIIKSNSVLNISGTSNFDSNYAIQGGAICSLDTTKLTFDGTISFNNNGHNTEYGGGMYLNTDSTFSILLNTTMYWKNNRATRGGAIYVDDSSIIYCTSLDKFAPPKKCFFQLPGQNLSSGLDVQLVFKNNSADDAGSVLYGGALALHHCKLTGLDTHNTIKVFDMLVHIEHDNTNSIIYPDRFYICPCENNLPNCSKSEITNTVYPGETFTVSVAASAAAQGNRTVPVTVRSRIQYAHDGNLQGHQYTQQTQNTCTPLDYTVLSPSRHVLLELYGDGPCAAFGDVMRVNLTVNHTCPSGFSLSTSNKSCVCDRRLVEKAFTNNCTITNGFGKITRDSSKKFWVGYDDSDGLILHPRCPFDYCVNYTVVFPLNRTDVQCAYNRSGLLCGACKEGYSLVLGTSQCKQCTNRFLILIIPFAVMGVALVFLLFVCKLTVATGTLSGLIFYTNIVGVNRTIFLPVESTHALSIFIAWLNLDFGIETCFFDGMDAYSKTWLQFVFPAYLWLLVGLMILISHYSDRFAKLLGKNPVPILATLILLSYAKILRTLITVIYFTYLEYPTYNKIVWLYNGNIAYVSGRHIPLFIVAMLVFLFLFLPYTLLLLFGQWLQAISHLRLFSWVNRLKPFMDSYHAPYKAKHRNWPGLLLVLRFVLFLVFASNPQQDPSINLLAIQMGAGMLIIWAWVSGGVYRSWRLDALEGSFALNLIALAAVTYHIKLTEGNQHSQLAVGYTSVTVAFTTFIAILAFQLANVTGFDKYLKRKCSALRRSTRYEHHVETDMENDSDILPDRLINPLEYEAPLNNAQEHDEPTESDESVDEPQRKILPVYTNDSIN